MRRIKFTFDDALLIAAIAALIYFKNWWATSFLVLVVGYLILHYYQQKKREPKPEDNEFVIDEDSESFSSVELDIGLDYRPKPNHFRINEYRVDTDAPDLNQLYAEALRGLGFGTEVEVEEKKKGAAA